jgi:hypothetical protein
MSDLQIDIGFHDYGHVRPLIDGTVGIEGVDATFHTERIVSDIFERMVRHREFGVSELGLTFYLRTLDLEDPPFIALPVFLVRQFRHSAIFVNTSSGIDSPHDLAGKTVGEFATYGHDAGVNAKGMLSDEFGVTPDQCRWVMGGFDWPLAHTVVIRCDLAAARPGLAESVYQAFCEAKDLAMQQYRTGRIFNHMDVMMPWISGLYDDNLSLFGEDRWPYGVAANRTAVDAFLRWHHEQGLSKRRLTCEDIFAAELMNR